MKSSKLLMIIILAIGLGAGMVSCKKKEEGPMEKMGKSIDKATHDVEKDAKKVSKDVKKAVKDAEGHD